MEDKKLYCYSKNRNEYSDVTKDFKSTDPAYAAEACVNFLTQSTDAFSDPHNIVFERAIDTGKYIPVCMYFVIEADDWEEMVGTLGQWLDEEELEDAQPIVHSLYKKLVDQYIN